MMFNLLRKDAKIGLFYGVFEFAQSIVME